MTPCCAMIYLAAGRRHDRTSRECGSAGDHQDFVGLYAEGYGRLRYAPLEEDDNALFVYAGKENLFAEHKLMFPLLSHA